MLYYTGVKHGELEKTKKAPSEEESKKRRRSQVFLVLCCRVSKRPLVYVHRYNKSKSLWLFDATHPIRKYTIFITTNQYFETFVIITILVNCVIMALSDAPEEAEYIFTAIYSLEMIFKILARGFIFDKLTYLRDPWNWLDFSVVVLGYATLAPGANVNISGIRTFRVLRALRAISAIQGLKTMVNALLRSMRMLSDVLLLTAFFLCVFALVGLQLFAGKLHSRCVMQNISIPHNSSWYLEAMNESHWYDGFTVCGNNTGTMRCPLNYSCIEHAGPNPNYGYTSFDNFGWALLTSFQLLTLDYWEDVYFNILSSLGPWYTFYFIFVIFFGAFLVFNLMLAVVAVSYQQEAMQVTGKHKQYEQLIDAGFVHNTKRCSCPEMIFNGPILEVIKRFPESKGGANVITISQEKGATLPTKLSVGKILHVDRSLPVEKEEDDDDIEEGTEKVDTKEEVDKAKPAEPSVLGLKLREFVLKQRKEREMKEMMLGNGELTEETETSPSSVYRRASGQSSLSADTEDDQSRPQITYQFRAMVYLLITSPRFDIVIVVLILFNTVALAMEYHGMSRGYRKTLNIFNHVFTAVFILEMIIKLIALGAKGYVKSRWNIFDGVVVSISIIDLISELVAANEQGGALTIIRSMRLFRVLKIANSWPTMRLLVSAMARSVNALANLTVILGIVLYMFAVVGTQIFADQYKAENFPTNEVPDWNFNNFGNSFLVIFRILCGEWIEPLYDCMYVTGLWTPIFFIAALIIGNFLILNLFLALLLGSFAQLSYEEEAKSFNALQAKMKWQNLKGKFSRIATLFTKQKVTPLDRSISDEEVKKMSKMAQMVRRVSFASNTKSAAPASSSSSLNSFSSMASAMKNAGNAAANNNNNNNNKNSSAIPSCATIGNTAAGCIAGCTSGNCEANLTSQCCPKFDNRFTKQWAKIQAVCMKIKDNKFFDYFILTMIFGSSFILIFEDVHLPTKPKLAHVLGIFNIIFCILFIIEFILKVTALGVILYIKNGWNVLDFIIVVASIISLFALSSNLKTLRSIRTLRALRPLQAVSRWSGVKLIVNSLIKAIPSIANVVLVCLMFWLIFSILGVQFFGGKFYKCIDENGDRYDAAIIPNRNVCMAVNATWKRSAVNFDNALNGFLALFQVATFEGWIEVMRDAVDSTEIDHQPMKGNNRMAYIYFVIFVIIGSFVILNLFISVMIDNFYALKKQQDDYGSIKIFLSPTQKKWLSTVTKSMAKKPRKIMQRPLNYYLGRLFDVLCSAHFEGLLFAFILANMLFMTLEHYGQSQIFDDILLWTNVVFTSMFTVEMILKLIAFRKYFFNHAWNIFDLAIVVLSVTELILQVYKINVYVTLNVFRVARVLRIGRLLRFFNGARGIRRLLYVLINSSASVLHMGLLLFLLLFIYSIIGMTSFGEVKKTGALNDVVNFETFGSSILMLLRVSTSAGWNEVLDSLMIQPPDCERSLNDKGDVITNCPEVWAAVLFFVSYILFSFLVVVNMHIAIILENFNEAYQESENGVTDEDLEMYYAVWQLYDPLATQFVAFEKVPYLVANLGPPLGIPFPNKIAVHNLNLPMNTDDKVHCINLLQALIKNFYINSVDKEERVECVEMDAIIEKKRQTAFPILLKENIKLSSIDQLQRHRAATVIQKNFRYYRSLNINKPKLPLRITVGEAAVIDPVEENVNEDKNSKGCILQCFHSTIELKEDNIIERTKERGTGTEVVQIHNVSPPIKKLLPIIDRNRCYHSDGPSPTNYHSDGPTPSLVSEVPTTLLVERNEQEICVPDTTMTSASQREQGGGGSDVQQQQQHPRHRSGDEQSVTYSVPSEVSLNLSTHTLRERDPVVRDPNSPGNSDLNSSNEPDRNTTAEQRYKPPIRDGVR